MTGLELYHSKIKNWILKVVSNLPIPTKTSDLENDSGFTKIVVSDEPPAEGTPDDVLTAILDGDATDLGKWESIATKIGSLDSTATAENINIVFNRALNLCILTGYITYGSNKTKSKIFTFNSDLPGNSTTRLFSTDSIVRCGSTVGLMRIRPNDDVNADFARAISVDSATEWSKVDGINVVFNVQNYHDEFCAYLDAKA